MRSAQKSNRSRGRGGRKGNGNSVNRVYESNGPEGKVRGTPQQIYDKYISLARDAQTSGDRVIAENFLQHAEHYQRILTQAMAAHQERREAMNGEDHHRGDVEISDTAQPAAAKAEPVATQSPEPPAVSGMTTIDSSTDGDDRGDLLVATEESGGEQPRPRRGNGRSRRKQDPDREATDADPEAGRD